MTLLGLTSRASKRGLSVRRVAHWLVVRDQLDRNRLITLIDRRQPDHLAQLRLVITEADLLTTK